MATQADVRRIALALPNVEEAPDSKKFFTEAHYDGYPAVHVRLAEVTAKELKPLLAEAWQIQAPKELKR